MGWCAVILCLTCNLLDLISVELLGINVVHIAFDQSENKKDLVNCRIGSNQWQTAKTDHCLGRNCALSQIYMLVFSYYLVVIIVFLKLTILILLVLPGMSNKHVINRQSIWI